MDGPGSLDLRSLALFRIALGLYLCYDVYSRFILGEMDLGWYTSNEPTSFLAADDTPHRAPLHRLWFYRGNLQFQASMAGLTATFAFNHAVGFGATSRWGALLSKVVLFVLVVAQQNRNMLLHDGSDSFVRHLVFWSIFLPLNDVWSVDNLLDEGKFRPTVVPSRSYYVVSSVACWALTTQVLLMYWGTVFHRTLDRFGTDSSLEWLPPDWSAVHYVMNGSFAVRDNSVVRYLQTHPFLTQLLTAATMGVELTVPFLAWYGGRRRHWYGAILVLFHASLLITIRLPNWQWVGMLTQTIWIPTSFWSNPAAASDNSDDHKKTDGDDSAAPAATRNPSNNSVPTVPPHERRQANLVSRVIQWFLFVYMLFNFAGIRGWIPQLDRGDIGEGLRLNQYWVMFASVVRTADNLYLTGTYGNGTRLDVLELLSGNANVAPTFPTAGNRSTYIYDMSRRYPSARWERAISNWSNQSPAVRQGRIQHFGKALCRSLDVFLHIKEMAELEFRYQHLPLQPLGSPERYGKHPVRPDTVIAVSCEPMPSVQNPTHTTAIDDDGITAR